jgi:hypothetical protein
MSLLAHPLVGVATGVLLSFLVVLHQCKNPSQIPRSTIWFRAFFGVALFLIVWFVFSATVFVFLAQIPNPLELANATNFILQEGDGPIRWLSGSMVGFLTPQLMPTEQLLQRKSFSGPWRPFLRHVVRFNEYTRGYLHKIVDREERKIVDVVMGGHFVERGPLAVDRMYEFHKGSIVKSLVAHQPEPEMKEKALGFWLHCETKAKCTLLLRYLGKREFLGSLTTVAADPLRLYPTWSLSRGDQRKYQRRRTPLATQDRDRRNEIAYGRRACDSPYARDWILFKDGDSRSD